MTARIQLDATPGSASMHTGVQHGEYQTLEPSDQTSSQLPIGPYNDRLHFTPVWFKDGDYIATATLSSIWTPSGMLWINVQNPAVKIKGGMYDDWYVR